MKTRRLLLASLLFCGAASAAVPSSINNDDSCDVKVGPAATLLLPYFEVDITGASGQTTLFTVTNVSRYPQIAHVTLWTDLAYPVLSFNLYLTGYDVQAINLADVLIPGLIAPPNGTTSATTPGPLSAAGSGNLRASLDCAAIPGTIPATIMTAVRSAFTTGVFQSAGTGSCQSAVGHPHANAIGYATIDVVASCTTRSPADPLYYTNDLLFDNVLIGDYQQLGAHRVGDATFDGFGAAGNPMVHIRAVPEGGGAGSTVQTTLPYTFYDRYTPAEARTFDRRQPLPSTFAARFISGGTGAFATNLTIWREGVGSGSCADTVHSVAMPIGELVRFDEHENSFLFGPSNIGEGLPFRPVLPATSTTALSNTTDYPPASGTDVGGWMYLNLNNGGSATYSVTHDVAGVPVPTNARTSLAPAGSTTITGPRPSQNWVTISMFGFIRDHRLTAELDAAPLGNGCTPAAFISVDLLAAPPPSTGGPPIGPAGGVFVCPPGTTLTSGSTAQCTGTNVNPIP